MEGFLGILIFAAVLFGIYYFQKATNAAGKKFTQSVLQPKSHQAGQALVAETHVFKVNATPTQLQRAILAGVAAANTAPAVKPSLYLVQVDPDIVIYDYGTKLQTVFRFAVSFSGSHNETTGVFTFSNWMESSGLVARQKEMRQLNADVETALRRLDSAASISVSR